VQRSGFGLSSQTVAGTAVFGALAVILTTISQALGLNFPVIPYLQFDLGEVAILLSMFILGPVPAVLSAFVEWGTLMFVGQFVPVGPLLKLFAILSSLLGIWLGLRVASKLRSTTLNRFVGFGTIAGIVSRVLVMTVANYLLIVILFSIPVLAAIVSSPFRLVGIGVTPENALVVVLVFTGIFNALQLALVSSISAVVVHSSQIRNSRLAGRLPWIIVLVYGNDSPMKSKEAGPRAILPQ
jgi:riboflavin transporter FmnP